MSMQYIRTHYRVPAKRGRRITFEGQPGVIVGSRDQYLRVRLDWDPTTVYDIHPTWEVEYHVPVWPDDFRAGDLPSCSCGYNGSPEECEESRRAEATNA